ncbi:MAG: CoA pyrophosphatase [Desulfamplus sp.]|nr:CoA pyrophosphatase [Desulfamplus sp.]
MSGTKNCRDMLKNAVQRFDHPPEPDSRLFRPTSVIALFAKGDSPDSPCLIFIEKADIPGYPWRNQMAFPGGNCDPEDPSREATALRELDEEMRIAPRDVELIGSIGHFQTINNKDIEAFLGIWKEMGDILFDPCEISRVFMIPLSHLMAVHKQKNFMRRKPGIYELVYPYEDVVIWGVTAKIVHHLLEILISEISSFHVAGSYGRPC